jgi:CRISPR-associated protein Cas1
MAKQIVQAKVHNQRQVLMRFSQDEPGHQPASAEGIRQINDLYPRVESACDLDAVRGLEGACARAYWQGFAEMLKAEGVGFSHRQYHPSPDPVNAALSLGYALMTSMLHSLLDAAGFDPFLGFFHVEAYGRPSLALDLLEPLRSPIIDRLVVRLFNLRMLKLLDFEEDGEGGVQLTSKGFRVFFGEYEKQLAREDVRAQVRGQIEQLRRVYCDQADRLEPYLWRAR